MMSAATVPIVGIGSEKPPEYYRPIAQAISNRPATKRPSHDMFPMNYPQIGLQGSILPDTDICREVHYPY
jgi:hypothetical protein